MDNFKTLNDSSVKAHRKGDVKVQFVDASEQCKGYSQLASKPPEIPRSSSSSLKLRSSNSANSSISNLSACNSNSVGSKLNRGSSSTSSYRSDTFGSTTSLDRRKGGSYKTRSNERTLQPISNAKRSQSLDRRKLEQSLYESSSSLVLSPNDRKKKERNDNTNNYERRYKSRSPYSVGNGQLSEYIGKNDRPFKLFHRPKTSHPAFYSPDHSPYAPSVSGRDSMTEKTVSSKQFSFMQKVKRASSKSPHRKSSKLSYKDDEKENDKSKERNSRNNEESKNDRERGRSLRRDAGSGRLVPEHWNNDNL